MRATVALCSLAVAAGFAACGPSSQEPERRSARLERELRQAKAADFQGLLETRTAEFGKAISDAELNAKVQEIEGRRKHIRELTEQIEAMKAANPE